MNRPAVDIRALESAAHLAVILGAEIQGLVPRNSAFRHDTIVRCAGLSRELDQAVERARTANLWQADPIACARWLHLDLAWSQAKDLARLDIDLGGNRALARDFASIQKLARNLLHEIDQSAWGKAADWPTAGLAAVPAGRVAAPAGMMAAAAARVLPARDRARYAEEYRSELWELASSGDPFRRQLAYALRLLRSAILLRSELHVPRKRKAGP
jgi:hypothetical protein